MFEKTTFTAAQTSMADPPAQTSTGRNETNVINYTDDMDIENELEIEDQKLEEMRSKYGTTDIVVIENMFKKRESSSSGLDRETEELFSGIAEIIKKKKHN